MKKRVLLVLLLIFALLLCGCGNRADTPTEPSENEPAVQTPEQNDPSPSSPAPEDPEPPVEVVCPNPVIANLLDTINEALSQAGYPIQLEHPADLTHSGYLTVLYTASGKNPYANHLQVYLSQGNDPLGHTPYGDSFSCAAYDDPAPEVEAAAELIFATALPLYDSALNDHYIEAFLSLRPEGGQVSRNIYGVSSVDGIQASADSSITNRHTIRGLELARVESVSASVRSVNYSILRVKTLRPAMSPVYRQDMLDMLSEAYTVEGPLNIETDTEDWIGEYSDAVIFHPEHGQIDMGFNSHIADEAIRVTYANYYTEADSVKLAWYTDVCTRMLAFCGDQFDAEEQAEIIAALRNLTDGEELEFESESRSMQVQLRMNGNTYVFIIRMEIGDDPLTEEELAEVNSWFSWDKEPDSYPAGNSFLTCIYQQPSEMNLFEVFGGQGGTDNQHGQITDAERSALAKIQAYFGDGYEVQKFKRSSMDKILKAHTGYKLNDQQWSGLDAFVYLDNYDAYYTVYGGTNKSSYTMVDGWKNLDGTLSLVYKNDRTVYETGYEYCVVTLKPAESGNGFHGYWFVSNLPYIN